MLDVWPIDRGVVERVARIVGNGSAAAQALSRAQSMREPLFFECVDRGGCGVIVMEREMFNALTDAPEGAVLDAEREEER